MNTIQEPIKSLLDLPTVRIEGPDYPTAAEMREMRLCGAMATLNTQISYCRRMSILAPHRAHAWENQMSSFVQQPRTMGGAK